MIVQLLREYSFYYGAQEVAGASRGASQKKVSRNFNWIWFLGAAVWFLNAALAMNHGNLHRGLANAAISAIFLAVGVFFRRMNRRQTGRGDGH